MVSGNIKTAIWTYYVSCITLLGIEYPTYLLTRGKEKNNDSWTFYSRLSCPGIRLCSRICRQGRSSYRREHPWHWDYFSYNDSTWFSLIVALFTLPLDKIRRQLLIRSQRKIHKLLWIVLFPVLIIFVATAVTNEKTKFPVDSLPVPSEQGLLP